MAKLDLDRNLDLSLPRDQEALRAAAIPNQKLAVAVDKYLTKYLEYFPEQDWRTVYSGGMLSIRSGKNSYGPDIEQMLGVTAMLSELSSCNGFSSLLEGFRNPMRVRATIFEVETAYWCLTRRLTRGLSFSPEVKATGCRPDFYWTTELGDLYVECKQASFHNELSRRLLRMQALVEQGYRRYPGWPDKSRVDITIEVPLLNGVEKRLERVIRSLSASTLGARVTEDEVTGVLRGRHEEIPSPPTTLRTMSVQVPARTSVLMNEANAHISLGLSTARYQATIAARLVREARAQLPKDGVGAIFLDGVTSRNVEKRLRRLVASSDFARTPWIAVSGGGKFQALYQLSQPFDGRLLEPRPGASLAPMRAESAELSAVWTS